MILRLAENLVNFLIEHTQNKIIIILLFSTTVLVELPSGTLYFHLFQTA